MEFAATLYSIEFILGIASALFYYKAAQMENASWPLWVGLSAGVHALVWRGFRWGWLGCLAAQIALLGGITLWRVLRDMRRRA